MSARAQGSPEILEFMKHKQPLTGGLLEPSDVAKAAWFLLSDESQQITGQVITVDGGWHLSA
jgi:enoyl-[acyl-carrier-protein] reductase (NADH)